MILAAGKGTRFADLTKTIPKALLPCVGSTLVERIIDQMLASDFKRILVGIGWNGSMIRSLIESKYPPTLVECIDVPDYEIGPLQTLVTSIAGINEISLICPVDFVTASKNIKHMVTSGEMLVTSDLIIATDNQPTTRDGTHLSIDENGRVDSVGQGPLRSAMMLLSSPSFLDQCRKSLTNGATTILQVMESSLSQGMNITSKNVLGIWFDIDSESDLLEANLEIMVKHLPLKGELFIPAGDVFEVGESLTLESGINIESGVLIKGPVLLHGTINVLGDSNIGPGVCIQGECTVGVDCAITESVIFGNSTIRPKSMLSRMIVHDSILYPV